MDAELDLRGCGAFEDWMHSQARECTSLQIV
jgi:hypothetical protein